MNLTRWISDHFIPHRSARPDIRLRISNLTRQTELAHCADVADHPAKRRKGLLGREMLSRGEGLWIVPCEAVHTFGMQFPIDLVYLDRDKRVKKIRNNMLPGRISACLFAHSVLELASGSVRRTQTKPGDRLEFSSASQLVGDRPISPDAWGIALPKPENKRGVGMDSIPDALTSAQPSGRVNPLRVVAACSMLAVGVFILAFSMSGNIAANRDFISYWAAGQQLVQHGNPYDGEAILRREQSVGFADNRPSFMRNPPYGVFLALPLGFVGARAGAVLWSLALVAALMGSIRMLWIMYGRPPGRLHLLGYCFPPTLACLLTGQIGMFILLGVVLFLYFHDSRPYVAGVALLLCVVKPHLFLPFGIVLIPWIVARKTYRILAGTLVALIASVALSFFLDPGGWSHYAHMVRASAIQNEFIPTISLMFRLVIHRNSVWLQFGPAFAGCVWGLWYYSSRREQWDWMDHGSMLLIVSVLVAPYAWFSDEAMLLPAVLAALYRVVDSGRSVLPLALIAGFALIEVLASVKITSPFYLWTVPVWLGWYLYAVRGTAAQSSNTYDPPPLAEGRKATL